MARAHHARCAGRLDDLDSDAAAGHFRARAISCQGSYGFAARGNAVTVAAPSLKKFVLHTFLWLLPCSAVWYVVAQYHSAVVGKLARVLVNQFTTGIVSALERSELSMVFVTTIKVQHETGQTALLTPEVNPLIYTYGLALFVALMLAERARWWRILAGAAVLLLFQSWSIAFEVLAQIMQLGTNVSDQAGVRGWRLMTVDIGYQLGTFIFPSLIPVLLWAASGQRIRDSIPASQLSNRAS